MPKRTRRARPIRADQRPPELRPTDAGAPVDGGTIQEIAIRLAYAATDWDAFKPTSDIDQELITRTGLILATVHELTNHSLDELSRAFSAGDGRAYAAVKELDANLGAFCDLMIQRCVEWRDREEWVALREATESAARLAMASGRHQQRAVALFLLGTACRAVGDNAGTIQAYERAIEAASIAKDDHVRGVALDNLGNALRDVGRLDEALLRYEEALRVESDPEGRHAILSNRASTLAALGELGTGAIALRDAVKELEKGGATASRLAVALDNAAVSMAELGEFDIALGMLERARRLFEAQDRAGLGVNAWSRANLHLERGEKGACATAFLEAHEYAFADARARIDREHYRRGLLTALLARRATNEEAADLLREGRIAKEAGDLTVALERWDRAILRARETGDEALALQTEANMAALFLEVGRIGEAVSLSTQVRHHAAKRGLALIESIAVGNLGGLATLGADIREPLGPLGSYAFSLVLRETEVWVVDQLPALSNVPDDLGDNGALDSQLAKLARRFNAVELATAYCSTAVAKARSLGLKFELMNRLAGLRSLFAQAGRAGEADKIADEIRLLLDGDDLSDLAQLVGHLDLGHHVAERDRSTAIAHLQRARTLAEAIRLKVPAGVQRTDLAHRYDDLYRLLARLLRQAGDPVLSFEALQGDKGRRALDALAARTGGSDVPPGATEVATLVKSLGTNPTTVLADLAVESDGVTAYLVDAAGVRAIHVDGDPSGLPKLEQGDVREREAGLVRACGSDLLVRKLADTINAAVPEQTPLLVVPDGALHNLPLHLTSIRGVPWCDQAPMSYLPGAGVLRFASRRSRGRARSLVAGDSRDDLNGAAVECELVAAHLGTTALLGQACTRDAIENGLRAGELDVIHLALHGRGDARRGGRASLLLADGVGGTTWIEFEELAKIAWQAELVVFSGCSTAVAGPRQGQGLFGVARAALEAGAEAVVACLWPVGDRATQVFMTAFYETLADARQTGPVDLRGVLDAGRSALRLWLQGANRETGRRRDGRGDNLGAMAQIQSVAVDAETRRSLEWAPFVLFGDPIFHG